LLIEKFWCNKEIHVNCKSDSENYGIKGITSVFIKMITSLIYLLQREVMEKYKIVIIFLIVLSFAIFL
jgi:hypothetical protein